MKRFYYNFNEIKKEKMQANEKYFIRTKGKAELKTFHLININTCNMLDIFFNTEEEAKQYAIKKSIDNS